MDLWKNAIEKRVIVEAKDVLQSPLGIRKVDFRYLKDNVPLIKKDKEYEIAQDDKTQSHSSLTNANQTQTQASKKNKR